MDKSKGCCLSESKPEAWWEKFNIVKHLREIVGLLEVARFYLLLVSCDTAKIRSYLENGLQAAYENSKKVGRRSRKTRCRKRK